MRPGPPDETLAGSVAWSAVADSWLGQTVIAASVPLVTGRITADVSQTVPEKLSLTVPRYSVVDGARYDWLPGDDVTAPLARYGQQLAVQVVTSSGVTGAQWVTRMGLFQIRSWAEQDNGSVAVDAVGMLQIIADDRLSWPVAPLPGGTFLSEFRRLLPSGFSLTVDPDLVDRACPQSLAWADDRLGALFDLADAWPARLRTTADGWRLALLPPLPNTPGPPDLTLTDGARGVVVRAPSADTRDGAFNRVVVRSTSTDAVGSPPIQVIVDQRTGPLTPGGDYRPVTMFYASPLLTSVGAAAAAGRTLLASHLRPSQVLTVTLAPDPRIDLDDSVLVRYRGRTVAGWVLAYDLPLTVDDGPMTLKVGIGS